MPEEPARGDPGLEPEVMQKGDSLPSRLSPASADQQRITIKAIGLSVLGGALLWLIEEFLQLRGFVSVEASRVVLLLMWVVATLLSLALIQSSMVRRKTVVALASSVILAVVLYGLDRVVPIPDQVKRAIAPSAKEIADELANRIPAPQPAPEAQLPVVTGVPDVDDRRGRRQDLRERLTKLYALGTAIKTICVLPTSECANKRTKWESDVENVLKFNATHLGKWRASIKHGPSPASEMLAELEVLTGLILDLDPTIESPTVIVMNCEYQWLPIRFAADSSLHVLDVAAHAGLARHFKNALAVDGVWPSESSFGEAAYRCELTSYEDFPLLTVLMRFMVTFREAVRSAESPGVTSSGTVVGSRVHPIEIQQIEARAKFTFYVYNSTSHYAQVALPEYATFDKTRPAQTVTVKMRQPRTITPLMLTPGKGSSEKR